MRDPSVYTQEDRYLEFIEENMPDMTPVTEAMRALVEAVAVMSDNVHLVRNSEKKAEFASTIQEAILDSIVFNEDDMVEMAVYDAHKDALTAGRIEAFGQTAYEKERDGCFVQMEAERAARMAAFTKMLDALNAQRAAIHSGAA